MIDKVTPRPSEAVAEDPGVLLPKKFLDEVMQVRFPNLYLGDTGAHIAVDISQMVGIRP